MESRAREWDGGTCAYNMRASAGEAGGGGARAHARTLRRLARKTRYVVQTVSAAWYSLWYGTSR
jgi:hypothetical protein